MKLSILIPSTYDREKILSVLIEDLQNQIDVCDAKDEVEIITNVDNRELTVGMKRNLLILNAKGSYISFIDSDDEVSKDYVFEILKAIETDCDVVGFFGYMTTNGLQEENFQISKDLPYETAIDAYGKKFYLRFNNHLSPIKKSIALQIMFPDKSFAEDYDYALRLKQSGLIKTETVIVKRLYHYKYKNPK